ncbi:MAG TPA: hypothetical protein VK028_11600 [Micromonosporaceae bacterium]|nr:hypothetical protein [Micromonosporaceae bacterium]
MSEQQVPRDEPPTDPPPRTPWPTPSSWHERRERVVQEVLRNRRGEYTVPTWVLAALLALILGVWITLIVLS